MLKENHIKFAKFFLLLVLMVLALSLIVIDSDNRRYKRNVENYQVPDVTLINQDNQPVKLVELLDIDKPVILQFIYTACTTVCPGMMVKFTNFQRRLEPDTEQALLVSISIDPENDTPEVLTGYSDSYQAQPGWVFLTGSPNDIYTVMAAFNTQPTDMSTLDSPVLLRAPGQNQWLRLTGEINNQTLWDEYKMITKSN